jgi:hypothetical protein
MVSQRPLPDQIREGDVLCRHGAATDTVRGTPKSKEVRWIDVYEDEPFDEAQMAEWVRQAAVLPGWVP